MSFEGVVVPTELEKMERNVLKRGRTTQMIRMASNAPIYIH